MTTLVGLGEAMGELREMGVNQLGLSFAGDVYNTLVYASCLGAGNCEAHLVSAVGDDVLSERFCEHAQSLGVTAHLYMQSEAALGLYLISTDREGERSFRYWRSASPARQMVSTLTGQQQAVMESASHILVSGITLAILEDEQRASLESRLSALKAAGASIMFDPNFRPALWESIDAARHWVSRFYQLSTIALPGLEDEQALFGSDTPESVLKRSDLENAEIVVVKAGRLGAYARISGSCFHASFVSPGKVVDTTAAGDGFNAAWLVAHIKRLSPVNCLRFASTVAACVASHPGAIVPTTALPSLAEFEDTP